VDEPVLDGVLGLGRAAGDEVCDAESDLLVLSDELLEGAPVAAPGARDELALVGWTALHRRNYTTDRSLVPSSERGRGASRRPGTTPDLDGERATSSAGSASASSPRRPARSSESARTRASPCTSPTGPGSAPRTPSCAGPPPSATTSGR